ncbi:MAG: single-stranded DNA-binding protein [Candidatus Dormibacteria bacterium]|jgi:hypothetical protein
MTAPGDLRYTATGKPVLNFGVATTAAGVTTFLELVAWQGAAETLAHYGGKGRELYVEGRIATRTREIDGQRVKQVEGVVLDSRPSDRVVALAAMRISALSVRYADRHGFANLPASAIRGEQLRLLRPDHRRT